MGSDIDWTKVSGGTTKTPYRQPNTMINTAEQLKAHIRDFDTMSLMDIINKLQAKGFSLTPMYYKELQDNLLKQEAKTGLPFSVLAGAEPPSPLIQAAFSEGTLGEGRSARDTRDYAGEQAADDARQAEQDRIQREWEAQQEAEARAYQAEQDRVQREWQAQQAEIERQNRFRLQRLGDLTQLVGQFAGIQARARETLAGLQVDPFKFAASKMGLAPEGVTPMQSFRGELGSFTGQPMPQIDPNAPLSGIEAQIMGLQGQMAPQAPKIFGMAGGGEVGPGNHRVLVGEEGPEIVEGGNFRVLPLSGRGASGYDTNSLLPALSPLYAGLGLSSIPKAGPMVGGHPGFSAPPNTGLLGYDPRFIRNSGTGATYYRNDADQLQGISPQQFQNYGFNWGDVFNVRDASLLPGQMGGALTAKPTAPVGQMPDAFGPLSTPIIEPTTGAMLPAPYRAAATLNYLRLTNPTFYQLALSAYANSMSRPGDPTSALGYSQESVEAEMRQALPTGQDHGLIGLR